jgi:hypothetical protein
MSKTIVLLTVVALSAYSAPKAMADETTAPPKSVGTVPTLNDIPAAAVCPPLSQNDRLTKDLHPGRKARAGGGTMIALGIATVVAGAVIMTEGQSNVGGGITAGLGGLSFLAGIPVTHVGVKEGKKARDDNATMTTSLPSKAGGSGLVGFQF